MGTLRQASVAAVLSVQSQKSQILCRFLLGLLQRDVNPSPTALVRTTYAGAMRVTHMQVCVGDANLSRSQ